MCIYNSERKKKQEVFVISKQYKNNLKDETEQ